MEENGGKWRNSEAQRRAASVGVRNKIVCKGMRSYLEEGGGRRVAKQGEVFQRCCRWFGLLFIRDCKRTFGVIISIMAATTTFLCGNKKFGLRAGFRPPFSGVNVCPFIPPIQSHFNHQWIGLVDFFFHRNTPHISWIFMVNTMVSC